MKLILEKEDVKVVIRALQFTVNSANRRIESIMRYNTNKKNATIACDKIKAESLGAKAMYEKIKHHLNIEMTDTQIEEVQS